MHRTSTGSVHRREQGIGNDDKPVAFVFESANGAIAEGILSHAATEARAKQYHHFYVIGFAIAAKARQFVEYRQNNLRLSAFN